MNDQSQIEAKIIHLTPPQRFQVAHQLPKDRPEVPNPVCLPSKIEEYKVVTTNSSKIWAIRILNGTWLLVTLFLKRCTRIDKNLLVVYVALVLLLLQVFMVISRAEARAMGAKYNLIPLMAAGGPSPFIRMELVSSKALMSSLRSVPLMEKDQKIKGFPKVPWAHGSARLLSARAALSALVTDVQNQSSEATGRNQGPFQPSGPPPDSKPGWPVRTGTGGHCRKARRNFESWCRAVTPVWVDGNVYERSAMSASAGQSLEPVNERGNHQPVVIAHITGDGSQTKPLITKSDNLNTDWQHTRIAPTLTSTRNRQFTTCAQAIDRSPVTLANNPPWLVRCAPICVGTNFPAPGAAAAFLCLLSFRCRKESKTRGSENENPGSAMKVALTRKLAPEFLSGPGVPQMITSTGS